MALDPSALLEGAFNPTSTPPERFTPVTAAPPVGLALPPILKSRWWNEAVEVALDGRPLGPVVTAPSYSRASFDPKRLPLVAKWAVRKIANLEAQAIVAIGHSGLVLAGAVSVLSGVPVFAVRKRGEEKLSHGFNTTSAIAGSGPVKRWIFLDDFVSSGNSLRWATSQVWQARLVQRPIPDAVLAYTGGIRPVIDERWVDEVDPSYRWTIGPSIPVHNYEEFP